MVNTIKEQTHELYDLNIVRTRFPFSYNNSMNVVLVQEIARYNGLIKVMHSSLEALSLAL